MQLMRHGLKGVWIETLDPIENLHDDKASIYFGKVAPILMPYVHLLQLSAGDNQL